MEISQVNADQLFRELTGLKEDMSRGFEGVHSRLDTVNGRTRKVEISTAIQWVLWLIVGAGAIAVIPVVWK